MRWDFLVFVAAAAIILGSAALSLELDIAPKSPKWRRIWGYFAYGAIGIFVIWMVILIGFIRPPR